MLWLSIGENCLTDNILARFGKKSFSSPYSPCRSNIDYALELEKNRYADWLLPENLEEGDAWGKRVIRSKIINKCSDNYNSAHMKGFEFTHHDPLVSEQHRESFVRKAERMNALRHKEDVISFYHHRICNKSDLVSLREKLIKFLNGYKSEKNVVKVAFFYQTLVDENSERKVESTYHGGDLMEFNFFTKAMWEGSDQEIFWGRVDNDLIQEMISYVSCITDGK